jgi:hypothetical protein
MGEQCVGQVGSVPRLGLRSLCLQDSPLGVRFGDYVSAFSSGQTVAATFDRSLMYQRGKAIGQEQKGKGVNVMLGPSAGPLGRMPTGGRNWEGFSVDPYLTGIGLAETVKGIQDAGVIACAKHYIANEQGKPFATVFPFSPAREPTLLTRITRTLPSGRRGSRLRFQHLRDALLQHRRQDHARTILVALRRCRQGWCRLLHVLVPTGQQLVRLPELQDPERPPEGRAGLPRIRSE